MASEFLKQMAQRQAQRTGLASPFLRTMAAMQSERAKEQVAALPERQTVPATTATVSSGPFTAPLEFREAERRNLAQNANVLDSMATRQTMPDYYSNEYGDILRQRLREAELESGKYAGLAAPALNMTPEFIDTYNKAMQAQRALQQAKSEYEKWQHDVYNKQQEQKIGQIEAVLNRPEAQTLAQGFDPKKISVSGKYASTKSKVKYALDDQYRTQVHVGAMAGGGVGDFAKYAQLNENEKNVLRYYAAQDDWEGAEQYLKALERTLNKRETQRLVEHERKTAEKYPGIGAISNILSGFGVPGAFVGTAAQAVSNAVTGEQAPADIYSPWYRTAHLQRASGEGVQNAAYKAALEATGSEAAAAVASFAAGTGLSIGNFLTKAPLGPAALPYMGLQAAGSTALEAQERGATAGTALLLGSAAGLIEAATEKLPLENLMKYGKAGKAGKRKVVEVLKQIAQQTAQQAAIEATEETISEVANTIVDIAVMGDKSGFNEYVKYLEQQGYDPQKARAEALFQYFAVNPAQAAAGGALSGGIAGGIFSTVGAIRGRGVDTQSDVQQPVQAAQSAAEVTEQPANISTSTAPETAQDAAQAARQTVIDILAGQVSNSKADTIVKTPVLAQAFREVTGIELNGTAAQQRAQVKAAAQNFAQSTAQESAMPEGVGAMSAAEPTPAKVSRVGKNTLANSPLLTQEQKQRYRVNDLTYNSTTNLKDIQAASERLALDYDGEVKDLAENGVRSSEDIHVMFAILADAIEKDGATGTSAREWMERLADAGSTGGQIVQAFSVYSSTPEGKVVQAVRAVDSINKMLPKSVVDGSDNVLNTIDDIRETAIKEIENIDKSVSDTGDISPSPAKAPKSTDAQYRKKRPRDHGVPVENWVPEIGKELAKQLSARYDYKPKARQTPITRTIISDLVKFAENYALPKRSPLVQRRAVDRIRDFFNNRQAYARAWNIARETLANKYKDNQQALDAFEEWLQGTLDYNAVGTDALMFKAITDVALDADINTQQVLKRAYLEDIDGVAEEIFSALNREVGATGADEIILRDAVRRYVVEKLQNSNIARAVGQDINKALKDIGIKMSELIRAGGDTKQAVAEKIADMLVTQYGISADAAQSAASKVVDLFNERVQTAALKALDKMSDDQNASKRDNRRKQTLRERIIELGNMGAFSSDKYRAKVAEKLFGKVELTDAEIKKIYDLMKQASELRKDDPGSREANVLEQRANQIIASKFPKTFGRKLITVLMDNMLGNIRTLLTRNAGGNLVFGLIETLGSHNVGAAVDALVGLATGERRLGFTGPQYFKEYGKGFAKGARDAILDFRDDVRTPRSGETLDVKDQIRAFSSSVMQMVDRFVQTGLDLGDRPFYEANYAARMQELTKLRDKNKLGKDFMENFDVLAPAEARWFALESVFQSKTEASEGFSMLKDGIGKLVQGMTGISLAGQFSIPFPRTPGGILQRTAEYLPGVGTIKNVIQTGKELKRGEFNQSRFSMESGRNIVGLLTAGGALAAAASGLITGGGGDDKEILKEAGWQEYSVKIGDTYFSYEWFPILGPLLGAAADYVEARRQHSENPLLKSVGTGLETVAKMSALQGLNRTFGGYGGMVRGLADTMLSGTGQFVPSLLRQFASATDEYERETYSPNAFVQQWNRIKSGVPGLRQTLPVRIDLYGKPQKKSQGRGFLSRAFENLISPSYISETQSDIVTDELMRLRETGNSVSFSAIPKKVDIDGDGYNESLTTEEYIRYGQTRGQALADIIESLANSEAYAKLRDDQKAEVIEKAEEQANALARYELRTGRGIDVKEVNEKNADEMVFARAWNDLQDTKGQDSESFKALVKLYDRMTYSQKTAIAKDVGEAAFEKMYDLAKADTTGNLFTDYYKLRDRMNIEDKERASKERINVRADVVNRYSGKQQEAMYKALFTDTYYEKYVKHGQKADVPPKAFFEIMDTKYGDNAKKEDVLKKMRSYNLSYAQRKAIYLACGYSEKTLSDIRW